MDYAKIIPMQTRDSRAVGDWLTHLRAAGRSPSTIRLRRVYVEQALTGRDPFTANTRDFEQWIVSHPEWSAETVRAAVAALRSFYRWMQAQGWREDNPAEALIQPRQPDPRPHPTPRAAYQAALESADDTTRLLLRLLATTGLRRTEACKVHTADLEGAWLTVKGKGQRVRQVPVPPDVAAAIRDAGGYLFPGRFGDHASAQWVTDRVRRATGYSAHSLRHMYATAVWNSTGDLLALQRLLGHVKAATTERYVLMDADRIAAAASTAWAA